MPWRARSCRQRDEILATNAKEPAWGKVEASTDREGEFRDLVCTTIWGHRDQGPNGTDVHVLKDVKHPGPIGHSDRKQCEHFEWMPR